MSSNDFSSSSQSYTSSSTTSNGQTTGHSSQQQVESNPSGTTVTSSSENLGGPSTHELRQYDEQGRELINGSAGKSVTDAEQAQRDAEYEERIEEEYAKREGGA